MDILPHLNFKKLSDLPAKWVCGYSDITTLTFPLTVKSDIATIHGSNLMNMGFKNIHETDLRVFYVMSEVNTKQQSFETYGGYAGWNNLDKDIYNLDKPSLWKSLAGSSQVSFKGRMIGGCLDTICKLAGTDFAPVSRFLEKYMDDGFIWTLESCEMNASDIYRTLWQLKECGWFKYANGIIIGRPDGYSDSKDFNYTDALRQGLDCLNIPVLYDADIGHIPPQIQIINGALGKVDFEDGHADVYQSLLS